MSEHKVAYSAEMADFFAGYPMLIRKLASTVLDSEINLETIENSRKNAIETVLKAAISGTDSAAGSIDLLSRDEWKLKTVASFEKDNDGSLKPSLANRSIDADTETGFSGRAFIGKNAVKSDDLAQTPDVTWYEEQHEINISKIEELQMHSVLAVPLMDIWDSREKPPLKRPIGVVVVEHTDRFHYRPEHLQLLSLLAEQLVELLYISELAMRSHFLSSTELHESLGNPELENIEEAILPHMAKASHIIPYHLATITVPMPDGNLYLAAWDPLKALNPTEEMKITFPDDDKSFTSRVYQSQEPEWENDLERASKEAMQVSHSKMNAEMAVPIKLEDGETWVLNIEHEKHYAYNDRDYKTLVRFAEYAKLFIEKNKLIMQLRSK